MQRKRSAFIPKGEISRDYREFNNQFINANDCLFDSDYLESLSDNQDVSFYKK